MNLGQFLLILRARWWIVVASLVVCTATAAGLTLMMPKQYTVSTSLLVDVKSSSPLMYGANGPALAMPGYMATQIDIMKSDGVAERVVELLKLDQSPAAKAKWQEETNGLGNFKRWMAELLERKISVRPARESNVMELNYTASDPDFAVAIANAFAQAFVETSVALSVAPAQHYSEFFQQRQAEMRSRLEEAQRKLTDYQLSHGIVAKEERLDAENQKLNELQSQLVAALGQDVDSSSKRASAAGDTLPEVLQSPVVAQLKSQIAVTEAKLQDMSHNLGANHPQYQASAAELASLKQKLAEETVRLSSSVDTAGRISHGKVGQLRQQIEESKRHLLDIKRKHVELDVLQQDVDNAQKALDSVSSRSVETRMQSQSNQTNVAVLSKAAAPSRPSSPRVLLNIALGLLAGGVLGIVAALARELSNRRVLCRDDLQQLPGFLILAELPAK